MLVLTLLLGVSGAALLLAGPFVARLVVRRGDPMGLGWVLQAVGILLLVAALLVRPHNPDNAAFPPPPEAATG